MFSWTFCFLQYVERFFIWHFKFNICPYPLFNASSSNCSIINFFIGYPDGYTQGDLIKVWKYLKGGCQEEGARLCSVVPSSGTRGNRQKWGFYSLVWRWPRTQDSMIFLPYKAQLSLISAEAADAQHFHKNWPSVACRTFCKWGISQFYRCGKLCFVKSLVLHESSVVKARIEAVIYSNIHLSYLRASFCFIEPCSRISCFCEKWYWSPTGT